MTYRLFGRTAFALAGMIPLVLGCAGDRAAGPNASPGSPNTIVFGSPDVANTYSNVGAFIIRRTSDGQFVPICSGTLIAPTLFLTAAHCIAYFESIADQGFTAYVSFRNLIAYGTKADAPTTASLIAVTQLIPNPGYTQRQSDAGDLGILVLAQAPAGVTPATLPSLGLLDDLAAQNGLKGSPFTVVGYGVQDRVVGGGQPFFTDANPVYRGYATASFMSLNKGFLRLSQNPSTGDAGACYGDSGGPNFLNVGGTQVLVAVTITGDSPCRATNVAYRLDTASAQSFLSQYVP
jgi:secreted trypsin-like serine protease